MTDNAAGFAALEKMIAKCRSLDTLVPEAMTEVSGCVQETISRAVASSTTPEGEPWKTTKDGHAPLRGAMGAMTFRTMGTSVFVTLRGYHVFHQRGTKRVPSRPMIPTGWPSTLKAELKALFKARYLNKMKGNKQ